MNKMNGDDLSEVIAWANKFIEEHREEFENMHGYTSEMRRADGLAKQIKTLRRKTRSDHSDARDS